MKKNTFKVMFVIRRNQVNRDGKCSITIRITVNGEYERLNSTLSIEPELWDSKAAKAIGRTQKILDFNKRIEEIRYVLQDHYYELQKAHGYVTAEMVKNAYMGVTAKAESLMPIYVEKSVQIDPCRRKNVTLFVEIRLTLGDEIKMTPVGILRRGFFL